MEKALLDTDIFSEVLKGRDAQVVARAEDYLAVHEVFTISVVTVMEIVRGLWRAQRFTRLEQFLEMIPDLEIITFGISGSVLAGKIDADLWRRGVPIGRSDPIIAAQALDRGLTLVSGNLSHYQRVIEAGYPLKLSNWRET